MFGWTCIVSFLTGIKELTIYHKHILFTCGFFCGNFYPPKGGFNTSFDVAHLKPIGVFRIFATVLLTLSNPLANAY